MRSDFYFQQQSDFSLLNNNIISVQYKPVAPVAQLVTSPPSDTLGREF